MEGVHLDDLGRRNGPGLQRGLYEHAEENSSTHVDGGRDEEDDLPLLPSFLRKEEQRSG